MGSLPSTRPVALPLSRRLLFPSLSPSEPLPSLLSSPAATQELNAELYDFIALALRAFVTPWWSKITRYDKEFLPQITRILTVFIRALEARLLVTNLSTLLFHHIPIVVAQHYRDYRSASAKFATSYAAGGAASLSQLFHQCQSHMAITADGKIDPEYLRQIVDYVLKSCLPEEDYQPEIERYIVREIIIKVMLDDIVPMIIQPWFIHKTILDLLSEDQYKPLTVRPSSPHSSSFSVHNLLVLVLSAVQTVSGACLTFVQMYKQLVNTVRRVNRSQEAASYAYPVSSATTSCSSSNVSGKLEPYASLKTPSTPCHHALPLISMFDEMFTFHSRLASATVLILIRTLSILFSPFLDRLLPYLLCTELKPTSILNFVRLTKRSLFPNGYPGLPPLEPSPEEQTEMQTRLLSWRPQGPLVHLVPFVFGPNPSQTLGSALDPLSSASCNAHLVLMLMDCIVLSLFPELGVACGRTDDT